MKAYSIEFRKKIVKAYEQGDTSIRKVAQRYFPLLAIKNNVSL
jgi:transposase-like protein